MELEFPAIEADAAAPAAPSTALAPVTEKPLDLAKVDLTAVALAHYGDWRKTVADVKASLAKTVLDLSTAAKCKEARSFRQRTVLDPLAEARKVSAGIKSKMATTSKAVGDELALIEKAWTEADALILPQITKREDELAEEKRKRDEAEKERKLGHEAAIAKVRNFLTVAQAPDMTAARLDKALELLRAMPTPTAEQFQEYAVPMGNAITETIDAIKVLHAKAVEDERIRRENEELRAKLAAAEAAKPAPTPAAPINEAGAAIPEGAAVEASAAPASPSVRERTAENLRTTLAGIAAEPVGVNAPAEPDTRPDLNVGAINKRLGFTLTREYIETTLGVPCDRTEKAASYWRASKWPTICDALVTRIADLRSL